jgi:hypothetical protein
VPVGGGDGGEGEVQVRLDDDENPFDSPLHQNILQEYFKITL